MRKRYAYRFHAWLLGHIGKEKEIRPHRTGRRILFQQQLETKKLWFWASFGAWHSVQIVHRGANVLLQEELCYWCPRKGSLWWTQQPLLTHSWVWLDSSITQACTQPEYRLKIYPLFSKKLHLSYKNTLPARKVICLAAELWTRSIKYPPEWWGSTASRVCSVTTVTEKRLEKQSAEEMMMQMQARGGGLRQTR